MKLVHYRRLRAGQAYSRWQVVGSCGYAIDTPKNIAVIDWLEKHGYKIPSQLFCDTRRQYTIVLKKAPPQAVSEAFKLPKFGKRSEPFKVDDFLALATHIGKRIRVRGTCEKCGIRTNWIVRVMDREAYWCGC